MQHRENILALENWLSLQIIGQKKLIKRLLMALLADGHLLVEGAPGLAKTKAIKLLKVPPLAGSRAIWLSRLSGLKFCESAMETLDNVSSAVFFCSSGSFVRKFFLHRLLSMLE